MGFDFGLKRVGVAVGHTDSGHAHALTTLRVRHGVPDWARVAALIEEWRPDSLVVGDPNSLRNQSVMDRLKQFTKELRRRFALPIYMVDERYSSLEARHRLQQSIHRKGSIKEKLDKVAAALIVETWLRENISEKRR